MKIISKNRKASFNYELLDRFEAGMVLKGWQVKSIKAGNASLNEAFAYLNKGECFLKGAQISFWQGMSEYDRKHAPSEIKLLLNKQELKKISTKLKTKGLTLVPTIMGLERGLIKVEIALGKGKKEYDKRKRVLARDQQKELKAEISSKYF
jgi:SsrA-binding protein